MAPLPVDRRLHPRALRPPLAASRLASRPAHAVGAAGLDPLDVTLDELLVQIERAEAGMWQLARAGDVGACETLIRLYDVRAHALGITPPKEHT